MENAEIKALIQIIGLEMGKIYEIVVFTASLSKYANPLLDLLDIHKVINWRLFREHCTYYRVSLAACLRAMSTNGAVAHTSASPWRFLSPLNRTVLNPCC